MMKRMGKTMITEQQRIGSCWIDADETAHAGIKGIRGICGIWCAINIREFDWRPWSSLAGADAKQWDYDVIFGRRP